MDSHENTSSAMSSMELATLAGGCFWCLEAVYQQLKGVHKVESGYAGGAEVNPSYQLVCSGVTGHAEVVQITFDPAVVAYRELLQVFFTIHDPTTLNRQGADVGTQYRSAIFYHSTQQKQAAEQVIAEMTAAQIWDHPIVTELQPYTVFYKAEQTHQNYYRTHASQSYCQVVIAPKVAKFRKLYFERLQAPVV
jgi:peptide-methionine (S)-S-oxide reductase